MEQQASDVWGIGEDILKIVPVEFKLPESWN
jgi:hypothetical protein